MSDSAIHSRSAAVRRKRRSRTEGRATLVPGGGGLLRPGIADHPEEAAGKSLRAGRRYERDAGEAVAPSRPEGAPTQDHESGTASQPSEAGRSQQAAEMGERGWARGDDQVRREYRAPIGGPQNGGPSRAIGHDLRRAVAVLLESPRQAGSGPVGPKVENGASGRAPDRFRDRIGAGDRRPADPANADATQGAGGVRSARPEFDRRRGSPQCPEPRNDPCLDSEPAADHDGVRRRAP